MVYGALYVMIVGMSLMPVWCVDSLVTAEPHLRQDKLPLVKAVVQFTLMMWPAMEMSHASLTVHTEVLEFTTVIMMKMQEQCVTLQLVSCILSMRLALTRIADCSLLFLEVLSTPVPTINSFAFLHYVASCSNHNYENGGSLFICCHPGPVQTIPDSFLHTGY